MGRMTDSEFEIMKVLWSRDEPMTSTEILNGIKGRHNWKLASLMTYLARMVDKGYVFCDRSTRTNYYSAVISQEAFRLEESESLLEKLYNKSATNLIASLYNGKKISSKEINDLRAYLDSLEGEEK